MSRDTFYVTTPIYYVNARPHIGHAYTNIVADALARRARLLGKDTIFLTGTDENAQKNVEAAEKAGKPVQAYVDEMSAIWRQTFDSLGFTHTDFIRTTEPRHIAGVNTFVKAVWDKGDIYKGSYTGLYCVGCEQFYKEADLINGVCPVHKTAPNQITEENYFFKLSAYREKLLTYICEHPDFIQPTARRTEVVSYIEKFMEDVSITRQSMQWGIPLPQDPTQAIYVWFDALVNYLTGVGYGTDEAQFQKYWPAQLHLVGKDIIKFHCALWPAMLMSAGLPLPERVFAHGYFTVDGEKMSKSLGNVVDPVAIAEKYGMDALRYYLLREIPFGEDGDFSEVRLRERFAGELANGVGNLTARVLGMAEKYCDAKVPASDAVLPAVQAAVEKAWKESDAAWDTLALHHALGSAWELIAVLDKTVNDEAPWKLEKENPARIPEVLYSLLEGVRHVAWLVWPVIPTAAEGMLERLGELDRARNMGMQEARAWGTLPAGQTIRKGEPLFPRLEE